MFSFAFGSTFFCWLQLSCFFVFDLAESFLPFNFVYFFGRLELPPMLPFSSGVLSLPFLFVFFSRVLLPGAFVVASSSP